MSGEGLHGRATLSVSTDRLAGLTGSSSALDSERSRLVAAPAKTSSTARAKAARDADLSRAVSNLSLESQRSLDVHVHPSTLGRYVRLNVGGSIFLTTLDTLCKQDNMLRAMFTGDLDVQTDKDGFVLIDRCGKHFGTLLNYLRDLSIHFPDNIGECTELLAEAKFYLFDSLSRRLEDHLASLKKESVPVCQIPVVASAEELHRVMEWSSQPIIRFTYNRSNNKYSYTSTSDENLIKNLELFDKISVRFQGRVMFVKDIVGSSEICCWYFYGHGRKQAEICCEAIVYATDKKQIKIEYPEAKIYEECLNIMLFEERCLDAERALQAQRRAAILSRRPAAVSAHVASDDDGP